LFQVKSAGRGLCHRQVLQPARQFRGAVKGERRQWQEQYQRQQSASTVEQGERDHPEGLGSAYTWP